MRRAKVGDLYCMKVPNGYKLYQWAYHIPKFGQYIRVFSGQYHEIPSDVEEIAASKHSYIVGFAAGKAYRLGLSEHLAIIRYRSNIHFLNICLEPPATMMIIKWMQYIFGK